MTVGLITVTHNGIGKAICDAAEAILGDPIGGVRHFGFEPGDHAEHVLDDMIAAIRELDDGDGVAVLTDLYGATPCNIARRLAPEQNVRVLSGISLPMVLRLLNYTHLPLEQVIQRATDGAHIGVIACGPPD